MPPHKRFSHQVGVMIDDDLHDRVKALAAVTQVSEAQVVRQALRHYLDYLSSLPTMGYDDYLSPAE